MCLGSGALLDAATSPYHGKGNDEQTLLRGLLNNLNTGEILVGDAFLPAISCWRNSDNVVSMACSSNMVPGVAAPTSDAAFG